MPSCPTLSRRDLLQDGARRALGAALAATPMTLPAAPRPLHPAPLQRLGRLIDTAIAGRRLPGAVLWVERAGAAPHTAVFGQRALDPAAEPLALDAVFDVASLTKPVVTGVLCAQLLDEGRFELDDPVSRHLPGNAERSEGGAPVTVRHLLTHCSGLPAVLPLDPAWQGAAAARALTLAAQPTDPPGTAFRYSDINYHLLDALLQAWTGEPLDRLARERVLQPLGLHDSGYLPLQRLPAARLVPTERIGTQVLRGQVHDPAARRMGGVAGHAGLFATAAELATFARMILGRGTLNGRTVLSGRTWAAMTTSQSPRGLPQRGLGWDIDSPYSRPRGRVWPVGGFGHTGFTGCAMWIDPASQGFYVFLSNRVHPAVREGIVDLYEAVGTAAAEACAG
jgi:CubicO group peptidase (beta-lactamase class C family)